MKPTALMKPTAWMLLFAVAAGALVIGSLAGCAGEGTPVPDRLLLVGIDSADWDVVLPLAEQGKMPNLHGLMERGVWCDLHSLEPKRKSPTIWATIATGKLPEKHGITDYVDASSNKLMTSNVRSARTFWDILGEAGKTVTVVGWLISWPAEDVNGFLVSDYFRHTPKPNRPLPDRLTYPESLTDELAPLRVSPDSISDEDLDRFIDLDRAVTGEEAQKLPVEEMFAEMRAINQLERRTGDMRDILAGDRTYLGVTKQLMETHPTDVTVVYLRGTDTASHKYWSDAHPGEVGFKVSRTENQVFGRVVERYYQYADQMLGELLDQFGDGTVIVCSDHGFDGPRPGVLPGGTNDHGPLGILVMAGDAFHSGQRLAEHSVRDITPTILALFGLPVGEDMDGAVVEDAFLPSFLDAHPVKSVPSYESR